MKRFYHRSILGFKTEKPGTCLILFLCLNCAYSQIPINSFQDIYYQNFNTLASSGGPSTILPSGWYIFESTGDGKYLINDGTNASGNIYSFGSSGDADRALGSLKTGTCNYSFGAQFVNTTGAVINSVFIEFAGEQWSLNHFNRHDKLSFKYSNNATSLNSGTWTEFSALSFTGKICSGMYPGALNGNADTNRFLINAEIPDIDIPPGGKFWIKWEDISATLTDDGLAVDDFSLQASSNCSVTINSFMPDYGPAGTRVTVEGTGLSTVTSVSINDIPCSELTLTDAGHLSFRVPVGATSGKIQCAGDCIAASSSNYIVVADNCFSEGGLLISELCDPINNYETDRYIEIYNPTSNTIDLNGWSVRAISNSPVDAECGPIVLCWNLTGSIQSAQALTCGYSNAVNVAHDFTNPHWYASSTVNDACYYWNGQYRDGAALYYNETRKDGIIRALENTGWYNDKSLIRNEQICAPDSNSSYLDWQVTEEVAYAGTYPSTPHQHTSTCISDNVPEIAFQPEDVITCIGSVADFHMTVADSTLDYQYQWMTFGGSGWNPLVNNEVFSGVQSASLRIKNASISMDGKQFFCQVTSDANECSAVSVAVQLSISTLPGPETHTIWHQSN